MGKQIIRDHYHTDKVGMGLFSMLTAMGGMIAGLIGGQMVVPDNDAKMGKPASEIAKAKYTLSVDALVKSEEVLLDAERKLVDANAKPTSADMVAYGQKKIDFSRAFYDTAYKIVLDPALSERDALSLAKDLAKKTNTVLPTWYEGGKDSMQFDYLAECKADMTGKIPAGAEAAAQQLVTCSVERTGQYVNNTIMGGVGGAFALLLGAPYVSAYRRRRQEKKEEQADREYQERIARFSPPEEMPPAPSYEQTPEPEETAKPVRVKRLSID